MKKILYLPLDERPCNYNFPQILASATEYEMIEPPKDILGNKKLPADTAKIRKWLLENVRDVSGAIISVDMLVYGGIVPSRLHEYSISDCIDRLSILKELKGLNPNLKIFAFNLIMRCPQYSSADEEPDYYEDYGREIFRTGYINHRIALGKADRNEIEELKGIKDKLPDSILKDYTDRRNVNREVNRRAIDYVKKDIIDFLVIPQDDSSPYGFTAIDQQYVRKYISQNRLNLKIYMYPGADEVGCTLLARMINEDKAVRPLVYTRFSGTKGPFVNPLFEDRILFESIKYQIICAGGILCSSLPEADIILMVNTPGETMGEALSYAGGSGIYDVEKNIPEFIEYMDYVVNTVKKPCVVADTAYANGADLELIEMMRQKKLLYKLAAYAGWNTSSNTLGTCISQGMLYKIYGNSKKHLDFLALRYVEDAGYCSFVRQLVTKEKLPSMGYNYFKVDGKRGKVSHMVKAELEKFVGDRLEYDNYSININDCYMPWNRMFEVGLEVQLVQEGK